MNIENFKIVLDKITADPSSWDQDSWHCGTTHCETTHCFAGWAQILSGKEADTITARNDAVRFLELTEAEAEYLFHTQRTIQDFEDFLKLTKIEYNEDDYDEDEDGFDSGGFDENGHGEDGCDEDGDD